MTRDDIKIPSVWLNTLKLIGGLLLTLVAVFLLFAKPAISDAVRAEMKAEAATRVEEDQRIRQDQQGLEQRTEKRLDRIETKLDKVLERIPGK